MSLFCFFFFQAEDGIRDIGVTGVQTCALPIFLDAVSVGFQLQWQDCTVLSANDGERGLAAFYEHDPDVVVLDVSVPRKRSEERRVGKECRSRWSPYH